MDEAEAEGEGEGEGEGKGKAHTRAGPLCGPISARRPSRLLSGSQASSTWTSLHHAPSAATTRHDTTQLDATSSHPRRNGILTAPDARDARMHHTSRLFYSPHRRPFALGLPLGPSHVPLRSLAHSFIHSLTHTLTHPPAHCWTPV